MLLFPIWTHLEMSTLTFWPVTIWKWLCRVNVVYRWSVEKRSCNMMQVSWVDVWLSRKNVSLPKNVACLVAQAAEEKLSYFLVAVACDLTYLLISVRWSATKTRLLCLEQYQERHWTNHQTAFTLFQALHTHTYTFVHVCVPACVCS